MITNYCRMHLIEVRGKSTRQIRKVYILLDEQMKTAVEKIINSRPDKSPVTEYVFAR